MSSRCCLSQTFQSGAHRAFLFSSVYNVYLGPPCDRPLRTGLHVVSDLYCSQCHVNVGWYYNLAYEQSQKYKENKAILVENTIYKHDTSGATADGHSLANSDGSSRSGTRASHDSVTRMRDDDDGEEDEQEEEDEHHDDGHDDDEDQREGRAPRSRRSSWMERHSILLSATAAAPLPLPTTSAATSALTTSRPVGLTSGARRVTRRPVAS